MGRIKPQAGYSLSSPLVGRVDIKQADATAINDELQDVDKSIVIPCKHTPPPQLDSHECFRQNVSDRLQLNKSDVLGYGGTARVYRARLHEEEVAAKVMLCPSIEPVMVRNFFKEASMLKKLEHKNIVSMRGVCYLPPTVCIVMEVCLGGDLTD